MVTTPWGPSSLVVRCLVTVLVDHRPQVHRVLSDVHHGGVVELEEGVGEHLPVRPALHLEGVPVGHLTEGVALNPEQHRAQVLPQRLARLGREVHEDEPGEGVTVHRHQSVVGLVEVEELSLLLCEGAGAVEAVPPPVVLADELPGGPARLFPGDVVPHEFVASVPADVVKGPDVLPVAHDDDRRVRDGLISLVK